jgi:hypothetical protein
MSLQTLKDVQSNVFSFLSEREQARLASVCREFRGRIYRIWAKKYPEISKNWAALKSLEPEQSNMDFARRVVRLSREIPSLFSVMGFSSPTSSLIHQSSPLSPWIQHLLATNFLDQKVESGRCMLLVAERGDEDAETLDQAKQAWDSHIELLNKYNTMELSEQYDDLLKLYSTKKELLESCDSLDLSEQPIYLLPTEFLSHFKNLKTLNLAGTFISVLPEILSEMDLESLYVDRMDSLDIDQQQVIRKMKNLKRIDLSNIPAWIGDLTSLKILCCHTGGGASFEELPPSFKNLVNLEHLIIYDDEFQELPSLLLEMPKLNGLFLESIPDNLLPFIQNWTARNKQSLNITIFDEEIGFEEIEEFKERIPEIKTAVENSGNYNLHISEEVNRLILRIERNSKAEAV